MDHITRSAFVRAEHECGSDRRGTCVVGACVPASRLPSGITRKHYISSARSSSPRASSIVIPVYAETTMTSQRNPAIGKDFTT